MKPTRFKMITYDKATLKPKEYIEVISFNKMIAYDTEALNELSKALAHQHKYIQDHLGTDYWGSCETCGKPVLESEIN